jgi:hypothetical protein
MSLERTVHVLQLAGFHFQAKEGRSHHLSTRHVPDPTLLCAAEEQSRPRARVPAVFVF